MFNLGGMELLLILVVALIVLGPEKLPGVMRSVGKTVGELRRASTEFQRTMNTELAISETKKESESAGKNSTPTPPGETAATAGKESAAASPGQEIAEPSKAEIDALYGLEQKEPLAQTRRRIALKPRNAVGRRPRKAALRPSKPLPDHDA